MKSKPGKISQPIFTQSEVGSIVPCRLMKFLGIELTVFSSCHQIQVIEEKTRGRESRSKRGKKAFSNKQEVWEFKDRKFGIK